MRLGELCAGYGGLGMAVEEVFNAETTWFSEFDAAPSKILAHHWPHVPNYGDMTKIDWATIEPVDIISGGTPCQDLSAAGRRAGMTEGTRSNLWVQMREAIAIQKPTYVVWENVRGAYSAKADSDLEQCPGCMGDAGDGGVVLRALGRVLGDLSDLGYDCQWRGLRAADVGACHGRFRVFVLAVRRTGLITTEDPHNRRGQKGHHGHQRGGEDRQRASAIPNSPDSRPGPTEDPNLPTGSERRKSAPRQEESRGSWPDAGGRSGAPATHPDSWDDTGWEQDQERSPVRGIAVERAGGSLYGGKTAADTSGDEPKRRGNTGVLGGQTGPGEVDGEERQRLREASCDSRSGTGINWGPYKPAIRRWEAVRGTAPSPTELTPKGNHRLSARFAEWMMGLPDGWVTDPAIGISRNEQLKACGNGVVPQQAVAALRDMLAAFETQRREAA